jgi:uncharacterized protein (TIGR03083 family)
VDTWELIKTERLRLADTLSEVSVDEWDKPSLCAGWRNRDALAHIVVTAEITPGKFFGGMVRSGFNFNKMSASDIDRTSSQSTEQLIARLRTAAPGPNHPPGPIESMLMEAVVHGEDIAYALGKKIDHEQEALTRAAEFAKGAQMLVGCRKRIAGLTLTATDYDWTTGSGPEVRGPLVSLLLAMSGRKQALDSLDGDGVAIMRERD